MPYSIPDDDEIEDALRYMMRRMKGINSLNKLRKLVLKHLKNIDKDYTVSSERLRKIAVTSSFIKTTIYTRQGKKKKKFSGKCPVCGGKLNLTKNETIFGGTVTLGYKCTKCPYWTTIRRRIPIRYSFEYQKEE